MLSWILELPQVLICLQLHLIKSLLLYIEAYFYQNFENDLYIHKPVKGSVWLIDDPKVYGEKNYELLQITIQTKKIQKWKQGKKLLFFNISWRENWKSKSTRAAPGVPVNLFWILEHIQVVFIYMSLVLDLSMPLLF